MSALSGHRLDSASLNDLNLRRRCHNHMNQPRKGHSEAPIFASQNYHQAYDQTAQLQVMRWRRYYEGLQVSVPFSAQEHSRRALSEGILMLRVPFLSGKPCCRRSHEALNRTASPPQAPVLHRPLVPNLATKYKATQRFPDRCCVPDVDRRVAQTIVVLRSI